MAAAAHPHHADCVSDPALAARCEQYERQVRTTRFVEAAAAKGRFAGRAKLEKAARWDDLALAKLRARLGIAEDGELEAAREAVVQRNLAGYYNTSRGTPQGDATALMLAGMPHQARVHWALKRPSDHFARIVASDELSARDAVRARRAAARDAAGVDVLAERAPGHAERVIVKRVVGRVAAAKQFRKATHGHARRVTVVERGREDATSDVSHVSPRDAGLPNAYAKVGFSVAQSTHHFFASAAILSAEVKALNARSEQALYLTPTLRVVQGRGTSLTIEHRGVRGGWSAR